MICGFGTEQVINQTNKQTNKHPNNNIEQTRHYEAATETAPFRRFRGAMRFASVAPISDCGWAPISRRRGVFHVGAGREKDAEEGPGVSGGRGARRRLSLGARRQTQDSLFPGGEK